MENTPHKPSRLTAGIFWACYTVTSSSILFLPLYLIPRPSNTLSSGNENKSHLEYISETQPSTLPSPPETRPSYTLR